MDLFHPLKLMECLYPSNSLLDAIYRQAYYGIYTIEVKTRRYVRTSCLSSDAFRPVVIKFHCIYIPGAGDHVSR